MHKTCAPRSARQRGVSLMTPSMHEYIARRPIRVSIIGPGSVSAIEEVILVAYQNLFVGRAQQFALTGQYIRLVPVTRLAIPSNRAIDNDV